MPFACWSSSQGLPTLVVWSPPSFACCVLSVRGFCAGLWSLLVLRNIQKVFWTVSAILGERDSLFLGTNMLYYVCLSSLADHACNAVVSAGLHQLGKNFRSQKHLGISRVTSVCPSGTRDWEGTKIIEGHPHCIAAWGIWISKSSLFSSRLYCYTNINIWCEAWKHISC